MLKGVATALIAFAFIWLVVVPIFERLAPPKTVRAYRRLTMPLFRPFAGLIPGFGVIETVGRRTGRRHQTPVGGRLTGNEFWFVSGLGRRSNFVRNIEADPRVRVKALGRWRSGVAELRPDDDARRRKYTVNPINGFFVWLAGGEHLSVRVKLDTDR